MYSDVSLEDVQDLNHKLEMLQQQVTNLADNSETKHARAKTETAVLQAKYHMMEVSGVERNGQLYLFQYR